LATAGENKRFDRLLPDLAMLPICEKLRRRKNAANATCESLEPKCAILVRSTSSELSEQKEQSK
jgi:hypothetical protein